jgi:flagellar biosynthetic protein FliR
MDLATFSIEEFQSFILILIRISVVLFLLPFFGRVGIPNILKAGMALSLTVFLMPFVTVDPSTFPTDVFSFGLLIISEAMMGIVLALVINLIFAAAQLAGQMIGYQMGFLIPGTVDPQFGMQSSLLSGFVYMLSFIIFVTLNGHHWLIRSMVASFEHVRPGALVVGNALYDKMLLLTGDMFQLAIKVAAPASLALLFTSVAMGIIAKTVPQMPILIVSMPLKIAIGFIFLGISMEMFLYLMKGSFENTVWNLIHVIKLM